MGICGCEQNIDPTDKSELKKRAISFKRKKSQMGTIKKNLEDQERQKKIHRDSPKTEE